MKTIRLCLKNKTPIQDIVKMGNTSTLSHYLNLLNNAGMLVVLEKFTSRKVRLKGSSPKFQVHNTAFLISLMDEDLKKF